MVRFGGGVLLFSAFSLAAPADRTPSPAPAQQVLVQKSKSEPNSPRKLQGRFLHITDIHPDPFYRANSDSDSGHACHSGIGSAGTFGAEITDCDSPFSLVNATFQWINDNLKDQIDFVIWTGDSARHDNDEEHPRTEKQVVDLNVYIVDKFVEVFGKNDNIDDPDPTNDFTIPIVPTFGNNDILPHNIFTPSPNKWTRVYASVWDHFVPEEQRHSFARGGWFFVEVIPNRLTVFSVNTLYFFDSNSAVDGCDAKSEPGYEHMEWLRIQLQFLRKRGMKAIMTGHVPPARTDSKASWDETCWQKWTLWMHLYRDVVVGSVFGHMNIDHFIFQDVKQLTYDFAIDSVEKDEEHDEENDQEEQETLGVSNTRERKRGEDFTIQTKNTYLNELRDFWSSLPSPPKGVSYSSANDEGFDGSKKAKRGKKSKKQKDREKFFKDIGGKWAERFSLAVVSPSVVPNFYPTLRVVEYNITGLEGETPAVETSIALLEDEDPEGSMWSESKATEEVEVDQVKPNADDEMDTASDSDYNDPTNAKTTKKKKKKKKPKKPPFPMPKPPSKSAPPGPAYSPQTFTWLGYTQYYANLTRINELAAKKSGKGDNIIVDYEVEYNTRNDSAIGGGFGYGYNMPDLTVREWLGLAERIGRESFGGKNEDEEMERGDGHDHPLADERRRWKSELKRSDDKGTPKNHLWRTFVKRAFVGTKPDDELDNEFG